ncbi:MAG: ABC transporter C-terminal domain-containing protein, partial [Deltaproteobacteria bacterium]|nr:ABC transporter C-terminal domain-containing protein [Deltaproteobacteria bacterium]
GNYSYFIQKRSEMAQADKGGGIDSATESGSAAGGQELPAAAKLFKTKEEKRLEAEERNRLSRITRDLKSELAAVEERIAGLEEKKAETEKILCAPDIHREPQKIKQLNQALVDLGRELETLYAAWEDLTEKLAYEQRATGIKD